MTLWLLKQDIVETIQQMIVHGAAPKAEAVAEFMAKREAEIAAADKPRNFTQAGDVAEIRVEGTLTTRPSLYAMLFGGGNTTYSEIIASIALAQNEPTVKRVVFDVRSPGGMVDGLFEALAAVQSLTKPKAVRGTQACSAAYAIAATAGRIQARNAAAEFGSIGVAATLLHFPELIEIASTKAPKKRPDPSTEAGKAVIREYLDQIHDLFVDAIATGRGIKPETVNAEFGEGATLLAAQAKQRKMIDGIMTQAPRLVGASAGEAASDYDALFAEPTATTVALTPPPEAKSTAAVAAQRGDKKMDPKEIQAAHPAAYAAILAEGKAQGVAEERDRVGSHLTMGLNAEGVKPKGAFETALKAVKDGTPMTQTLTAEYLSAAMNRRDRDDAQADSDAAGKVLAGAGGGSGSGTPEGGKDLGDTVADAMEAARGKGKNAA